MEAGNIDNNSRRLMELVTKYGVKKIPPEELELLGYAYDEHKNLASKTELERRKSIKSPQEIKDQKIPFGKIDVVLEQQDIQLRHELAPARRVEMKYEIGGKRHTIYDFLPETHPLKIFMGDFTSYLYRESIFAEDTPYPLLLWIEREYFTEISDGNIYSNLGIDKGERGLMLVDKLEELNDPENKEKREEETTKLHESLQRAKAKYCDLEILKRDFYRYTAGFDQKWQKTEGYSQKFIDYCREHGLTDEGSLMVHLLALFLEKEGMSGLGGKLIECKTLAEADKVIAKISGDDFPHT